MSTDFVKDIAPMADVVRASQQLHRVEEPEEPEEEPRGPSKFSQALAAVETHRRTVRWTIAVAVVARLAGDHRIHELVSRPLLLQQELPWIGLSLLSYLVVFWFLAARTRDRFGFAMALGIGVLETTYGLAGVALTEPLTVVAAWPMGALALGHLPMAIAAFRSSRAFPPHDSKRPWIFGFVTALVFLAIPWVTPAVLGALGF